MVAKWIAISIIAGLVITMIPVALVGLWTISKAFVAAVLLFLLIIGFIYLVIRAIENEIKIKRLAKEIEEILEQEKDDEEWK